ncbi:MAG: DinB family protein [Desulfobacteraceae bacterium]|nr:MAG: DinB family protein [Desulfobacteraceae bacterium]
MEQVSAFKVPPCKDLIAYYDAVRAKTKECLRGMQPEELDRNISLGNFGELPVATIFSFIVTHASQHIGEISYLRGLHRGLDK